jgi:hypothetical protein
MASRNGGTISAPSRKEVADLVLNDVAEHGALDLGGHCLRDGELVDGAELPLAPTLLFDEVNRERLVAAGLFARA